MHAFVTGSTGFLGRHLLSALQSDGAQVTVLARRPSPELEALGIKVALGDVLDQESVTRAMPACDVVFHCAGKVSRRREDATELHRVHATGTRNVLQAAKSAKVKRAVVASTSGVVAVSEKESEIKDETAKTPTEIVSRFPYYLSKLYAEEIALEQSSTDFEVMAVLPTLLLGPGDLLGSSTGDVVDLIEERFPFVPSGGMSFVDARDVARAMIQAFEKGRGGRRYLLHAQNLTLRAFAERIGRISGAKTPALTMPRSPLLARLGASWIEKARDRLPTLPALDPITAEMAQFYWYVDSTRAREELGFAPRDPMETLVETVEDLRRRGAAWPKA